MSIRIIHCPPAFVVQLETMLDHDRIDIHKQSMNRNDKREYTIILGLLIALGLVLVVTTIKGPFIIDEDNYLVTVIGLRQGVLTVPGTEGLTPSKELFFFDPEAYGRIASRTPVFSIAPPLYAPIALPFVFLGWRGLVLLNTISYLLTAFIVFVTVKHFSTERQTPWLAAALVLFGGYAIEYAQGVWPHMLSVCLVTSAVFAASRVWNGGRPQIAIICGLLMGIATGIREQNIILTGLLGITLLLFGVKKIVSSFWFALGALLPLTLIGIINFFRQGIFHPFPKAVAFSGQLTQSVSGSSTSSPLQMFWARVVDFSSYPPITDSHPISLLQKGSRIRRCLRIRSSEKGTNSIFSLGCPGVGNSNSCLAKQKSVFERCEKKSQSSLFVNPPFSCVHDIGGGSTNRWALLQSAIFS